MFADERRLFRDYIYNFMHEAVDFTHYAFFVNEGLVSLSLFLKDMDLLGGINTDNDFGLMIYIR